MSSLRLKSLSHSPSPFSWDSPSPSLSTKELASLASPPTAWLTARDMKIFACKPLTSLSDIGLVKCKECDKPILRSCMAEHQDLCATIRAGRGKASKNKLIAEDLAKGKKRKSSAEPDDPATGPAKKKVKPTPKVTKGRMKGPVDYDKQCGVINDKNLPCSRSLTCKSHSMGAKRSVQGRSRAYDELLLEWNRANNPNWVEPIKRETKAEKKAQREREKQEKKRLAAEAAAAMGIDPSASTTKKATATASAKKVSKKANAAAAAAVRLAEGMTDNTQEDLGDLDSETELDDLIKSVRTSQDKGLIGVPLAVPCDAGNWFVQRRERLRCCRDLFANSLSGNSGNGIGVMGAIGYTSRTTSGGSLGGVGLRHS